MEQKNKEWWDNRASQTDNPREVVGAGTHELQSETRSFIESSIAKLIMQANDDSVCLDAGCGTGLYIPVLLRYFKHVWGMDFSQAVLNKVDEPIRLNDRVKLFEGSITNIPLEANTLPFVFCRSTYQCIDQDDIMKANHEFYRVVKPGGFVLIHFKNASTVGYRLSSWKALMTFRFSHFRKFRQLLDQDTVDEQFVPGEVYFRPYKYYLKGFEAVGFAIKDYFSFQLFTWRYLEKRGNVSRFEKLERILRKTPLIGRILKTDGIDFYVLLEKKLQ
ncbi:MAG: class I SAM-dependent methyltransferase [Cyclobacteriaceae bacterium]|nr:class I SAM-dependent methyltransferase [Cyclobacteriaceae bacterium]UYN85603.1 MAG: class I SAM-dependent methyltransferase [Cyclobacteriaceae bacterium]